MNWAKLKSLIKIANNSLFVSSLQKQIKAFIPNFK